MCQFFHLFNQKRQSRWISEAIQEGESIQNDCEERANKYSYGDLTEQDFWEFKDRADQWFSSFEKKLIETAPDKVGSIQKSIDGTLIDPTNQSSGAIHGGIEQVLTILGELLIKHD